MKIVEVIPISRGIHKESLSYFTPYNISAGALVKVPLRGKIVNALVISSQPVENLRLELKNSTFAYKKTAAVVSESFLPIAFMNAAKKSAEYHVATLGSFLSSLVPKIVLENAKDLASKNTPEKIPQELHGAVLQTDDEDRFSHYRSLIREEFARGHSVFLCLPTISDSKRAEKLLEKGIGEYSYIFHGRIKKRELIERWDKIINEPHPVLIIATGQFFCVPRSDIGMVIIERENSKSYKSISRPFTDVRIFAEAFCKETNARLILGDTLLRTETVWRYRNGELGEVSPPTLRIQTSATQKIIDMRKIQTVKKFEPISPELYNLILRSSEKSEQLVIFTSRRGLSPLTVCADCGTVVTCRKCRVPIVLHSKADDRYFLCHRCGEKRDANEKCISCTSWRLQTLGVGIELIVDEIKQHFPEQRIVRFDSDTIKTNAQANSTIKKFYETPGGILIGTEMMFSYLDQKIPNVAVASIDSMFSMPDFRIREKILSILIRLRGLAQKNFCVQTRNINENVFALAEKGNLIDFYKQEFADREMFDYPPFTVIIKISFSGTQKVVEKNMEELRNYLIGYDISTYPAFSPWTKGQYNMHALIKIGKNRWVERNLYEKLKALPPSFTIMVDPESIL